MYVGMWGLAALFLLACIVLTGMMLGVFRLCDILTNAAHRLIGSKT